MSSFEGTSYKKFSSQKIKVPKYSSSDNFLSPILVSDWLILCCRNSILRQKKKRK